MYAAPVVRIGIIIPLAIATTIGISSVSPSTEMILDGFGISTLFAADGEYLPIVKVQPIYPRRALSRGIEGYVIVEFTVTRRGTIRNARIVEAKPAGIFDRSALQAAAKLKYKPWVVDGQPIEVPGVRNKMTFEIEE